MRNRKFNKELLNEELKKFKIISEYAFYEDRVQPDLEKGQEILLDKMYEAEDDEDNAADIPDEDINIPDEENEGGSEDPGFTDEEGNEEEGGFGDEQEEGGFGDEQEEGGFGDEQEEGDEVELDVTDLVKGSEEAKASADSANQKIDQLMSMINNLEGQIKSMEQISGKIDKLETELEKRAPTPEEKIEMRSLSSYPYNLKLTDFWANQENQYDIIPDKEKEYVLNQKTIDSDYSEKNVKDSFNNNEYEEEEF